MPLCLCVCVNLEYVHTFVTQPGKLTLTNLLKPSVGSTRWGTCQMFQCSAEFLEEVQQTFARTADTQSCETGICCTEDSVRYWLYASLMQWCIFYSNSKITKHCKCSMFCKKQQCKASLHFAYTKSPRLHHHQVIWWLSNCCNNYRLVFCIWWTCIHGHRECYWISRERVLAFSLSLGLSERCLTNLWSSCLN